MSAPITTLRLDSFPLDSASEHFAQEIADLPGVKQVSLLPDTFTKAKYLNLDYKITIPSSSTIVTEAEILYPQFRSRGINCGMMVVALPFTADTITQADIKAITAAFTLNPLYYALYRARLPLLPGQYDLSHKEFLAILSGQLEPLAERFRIGIPDGLMTDFGESAQTVDIQQQQQLLNQEWLNRRTVRMRHRFGRYFGGNHFFELQVADRTIPELGVVQNQVVATFHTGCQGIESVVEPKLARQYFYQDSYVSTKPGEAMYDAYFTAQAMLCNYGTAYRLATYAMLNDVVKRRTGEAASIVMDKSHNFVRREKLRDESVLVYRHNAERITPGSHALVSGLATVPSYIVRGGSATEAYNHSIDHGLGKVIAADTRPFLPGDWMVRMKRVPHGLELLGTTTNQFGATPPVVKEYFECLATHDIADVAGILRPIASLKYT